MDEFLQIKSPVELKSLCQDGMVNQDQKQEVDNGLDEEAPIDMEKRERSGEIIARDLQTEFDRSCQDYEDLHYEKSPRHQAAHSSSKTKMLTELRERFSSLKQSQQTYRIVREVRVKLI